MDTVFPLSVKRGNTADKVFHVLHEMIISGQLAAGQTLPNQEELAKQFKVSRNTLREAIFKLTALGLVTPKQGVGTIVMPSTPSNYISSLEDHLRLSGITMQEFIEARLIIECDTVRLAVVKASKENLTLLNENLKQQKKQLAKPGPNMDFNHLDLEFHEILANCAGNSVLTKFFLTILELLRQFVQQASLTVPDINALAYEAHMHIFHAVKRKDPDLAEQLIFEHIKSTVISAIEYGRLDFQVHDIFDAFVCARYGEPGLKSGPCAKFKKTARS